MTDEQDPVQHEPRRDADGFDCPRCGRWAHQQWAEIWAQIGSYRFGMEATIIGGQSTELWAIARCARCKKPSVWRGDQLVYPLARYGPQPHGDMPQPIADLYLEAATVAAVSPRAGAALARATVERLIKHLDTDAKACDSLNTRIERLQQRVSSNLQTMLHVVRVTGNDVLHQEQPGKLAVMVLDDENGPQLLEHLLRTANDLVDELITRQQTVDTLHGMLPEWVQKKLGLSAGLRDGTA